MTAVTIDAPAADDRMFYRTCVTVMAVLLVSGFVVQLATGRSSFNAPLIVHLHAVVFMGWVGIILTQAWLATGGNVGLHRRLGMVAVVWAAAMMVLGTLVTLATIQSGRTPFFFQPQHFLIGNAMTLVGFAGLLAAAIVLRKRTDWHARLQIGAFVMLMGPGFGRLIPMPLLAPYAFEAAGLVALAIPIYGMFRDWRVRGRPHPAWAWSAGALIAVMLVSRLIAFSPVGEAIFASATAGTVMAGVDGTAFPPPPGPPPLAP